jgi:DNA-binding LacI/PurR family transcriptional regulator
MANITEVAEAAGVSISTVSYALSGKRPVSMDTRLRVQAAVRELGYSPNAGARMLAGRRTQIFALTEPLRSDSHAPTHMSFVLAASVAARRHDYDILLLTDEQASAGMSRVAASGLVDAILVLDVGAHDERVGLSRQIDTPTIFIGVPDDHEGLVCVDLDFEAAAALAVDTLVDAGHRSLGLIGQPVVAYEKSNFPPRVRRAYEASATRREADARFFSSGDRASSADAVRAAVDDLIDSGVTGLVLHAADDVHLMVLARLAERGRRIPDDMSVISVGTSFDAAALLPVGIDVIPLIPEASCELAVELALQSLSPEPPEVKLHLIAPTYLSRGSVAPAPRS